ncbi:MAG: exodeoxyribonuclease VII large subunit [Candidatus Onthomorpha sp.]
MPVFEQSIGDKAFSLSEVTASIRRTISSRYGSSFWVRAEMIKLNHYPYSGHAFPDLIEKKDGVIVAQMRAIIWSGDLKRINEKFFRCGMGALSDGVSILFRATIMYDEFHGLSLRIIDIDTSFTLGELEKQRINCIERLKAEKIFALNKSKQLSALPKRFAIISVESSKGYNDFMKVVLSHSPKFAIFTHLFPSLLQGEGAVYSMLQAFERIEAVAEFFDAVLIIRGGGGDVGLSCYNDYRLCRAVALCSLPVLTGIGHSTNQTVAEQTAWHDFITPTDLADSILGYHETALQNITEARNSLLSCSDDVLKREKQNIVQTRVELIEKIKRRMSREREDLTIRGKYLRLLSPDLLLKKGYSITYKENKVVLSAHCLKEGDTIRTKFSDGEVISTVNKIKQ